TLLGSTTTGVNPGLIGHRLTNLTQLTIDTSWWTRYRDDSHNPDLDPTHVFPQAVPTLGVNQHTAIPRTDADTSDPTFLQAIANTAGFHFPTIEQGGNSLYPSLAQRATHEETIRILISIGPTETEGVAMGALQFLTNMGLFIGQSPAFFAYMTDLAQQADHARHGR